MIDFLTIGGIITDIIILAILLISISHGYRRGLSLVLYQAVALILTIILVLTLCKPVTNWVIANTELDEFLSERIEKVLESTFENIGDGELIELEESNISETIAKKINTYISEAKENAEENITGYVATNLSHFVVSGLVVLGLTIIIRIASIFIRFAVSILASLPFINQIDKLGGLIFGTIRGFAIVYLLLAVISLISPLLADSTITGMISNSNICSKLYNNNILLNIFVK